MAVTGSPVKTIFGIAIPSDWMANEMTMELIHRMTGFRISFQDISREWPEDAYMLEMFLTLELYKATNDMTRYHSLQQKYANLRQQSQANMIAQQAQNQVNQQYQNAMNNQNFLGKLGYAAQQGIATPKPKTGTDSHADDMAAIMMRMRWKKHPFEFFQCYQKKDGDRIILIIGDEKPVTIEDGGALFPSDKLVGQLRLLEGALAK